MYRDVEWKELMSMKNAQHACATNSNLSFHFARTGMRVATVARKATSAVSFVTVLYRNRFRGFKLPVSRSLLTILVKVGRVV